LSQPASNDLRVLLVDRDESHRHALAERLQAQDWEVREADGPPQMYQALGERLYSAVVCDLEPAGESGQRILQTLLSAPGRPAVILFGADDDLVDRLLGLELGADDYMAKPVNARELTARVKAVLRGRLKGQGAANDNRGDRLLFAGFELNLDEETLYGPDGAPISLPRAEYLMLRALLERPGRVVTRARLQALSSAHDWTADSRAVDLRVSRLRRRLAAGGEVIRTYRGRGYLLTVEVKAG
jgi:two-component system OmpR family response regulator